MMDAHEVLTILALLSMVSLIIHTLHTYTGNEFLVNTFASCACGGLLGRLLFGWTLVGTVVGFLVSPMGVMLASRGAEINYEAGKGFSATLGNLIQVGTPSTAPKIGKCIAKEESDGERRRRIRLGS
ncbi:hypothetical protein DFJ74DRAFT_670583 [Hyaloraphidium curvatum]|nr:hypothetical protein DFJ74DRAFT_670583 [Hyaloraphidium curvatum]